MHSPIKAGDVVTIRPEWRDAGDEAISFVAIENEDGGRVRIRAELGLAINPNQIVNTAMLEKTAPTISMRDFFALPEVIALQEIQKRNRYGSELHREAHENMRLIARGFGAASFFAEY